MKQYNNKYKNVFYENRNWRLYDETKTDSYDAFYSETQIKLIEMIEKYNFKIFYFYCEPATKLKLTVNDCCIDLNTNDIKQIKENQLHDFYFFYENQICEIFYSFLKLDEKNNYYFDFMLVVNNNFDLNLILNKKFKSVKIKSVKPIFLNEINFEFVKNIYEKRTITLNNISPPFDENYYDLHELEYGYENYIKNIKNNSENWDHQEYFNFSSFYFYKNFDTDKYVKNQFKTLCSHIWSLSRYHYIEKNKFGLCITYKDQYNLNSPFLTNYAELMNCRSFNVDENKNIELKKENYTYCSLLDNLNDQGINFSDFDKKIIKTNTIEFDKLKVFDESFSYE